MTNRSTGRDAGRVEAAGRTSPTHPRKYAKLARTEYFEPVVQTARAYLAVAVADPAGTAREYWSLSCLPGTTPWRLSAITMRTMDALVVNRPRRVGEQGAQAFVIVERSTLDGEFGGREAVRDALPDLDVVDSDYYEAGPDQALIHGGWREVVAAFDHPAVAAAARRLAGRVMGMGRTLHWRGHNHLLAADVLGGE